MIRLSFLQRHRIILRAWLFACIISLATAADVREHGAKGDGVADDTEAVRKAVAAGGAVRFPAGTYRLTETIAIELKTTGYLALVGDGAAAVRMDGAGPAFHFVGTQEKTASPADFPAAFWSTQMMPKVQGLTIVGGHPQATRARSRQRASASSAAAIAAMASMSGTRTAATSPARNRVCRLET